MPTWLDPSNVPSWVYFALLLTGGGAATGLNFFGDNDAKQADIARLEEQVLVLDEKVDAFDHKQDEVLEKFTELRILIAQHHSRID